MPGAKAEMIPARNCGSPRPFSFASRLIVGIVLLAASQPALAHEGTGLAGGFVAGFQHPLTGPDHMLAMIAVGLWGAFLWRPLIYLLPVIFPIMMTFGGAVAIAGVPLPPVEIGIALSVVVLGAMILGAVRAPIWVACTIVGIFGLFHGYAHGLELPSAADPVGYSAGFVLATGLLHIFGIVLGSLRSRPGGDLVVRTLGGVIVIAGFWFLANTLF